MQVKLLGIIIFQTNNLFINWSHYITQYIYYFVLRHLSKLPQKKGSKDGKDSDISINADH